MSLAYACSCLNVRLHVASSIDTSTALTDELGPELTGWKLPLGVGGIVIEQKPLVRLRQVSHAPSWATLSCLVCGTHNVFSVLFDNNHTHLHHPDWEKLLIPESNNIIVHKGLKDTTEIETLKQQSNYSRAFKLVMRPTDDSQTASNSSDHPEFSKLRDELQMTFTKAIKLEDEKTRERIEAYKKQQEEELVTFRGNAQTELQRLEAMISESLQKPKRKENKQEDKGENTNQDDKVESSDYMSSSGTLKKSIARQRVRFEESDQTGTSSKLVERHEHTSNLGQAIEERRVTSDDNANIEENEGSEDEEDMFELDEELETHADGNIHDEDTSQELDKQDEDEDKVESDNTNFLKSSSLPASSPLLMKAHRRNSQKYRAGDTWDEIQDKDDSVGDSQDLTMYATSLPITINRRVKPSLNVKDSDQAHKEETTIGSNNNKVLHYGTYDPAQRDLAASAQFQSSTAPLNPRKSSGSRSFNRTLVDGSLRHNQSDEEDDDDSGPMIPPHILAAQTYVDETGELFGTVPDTDR